jgi:hypothetical protein
VVVYPREGHSIEERAHQIDLQNRVLAWYEKYPRRGASLRSARVTLVIYRTRVFTERNNWAGFSERVR